jgi:hypothetical protein
MTIDDDAVPMTTNEQWSSNLVVNVALWPAGSRWFLDERVLVTNCTSLNLYRRL